MPVACLSIPGAQEDLAGWSRVVVPGPVHPAAGALLPAGLGSCTGLYVAVRRIRRAEGLARVHIDDMHRARLS